ncbi:DUF6893 family small protein [Rhodococcoides kyotonense]|uniref:Uncharacterized protein n=1 Tax=Rhodococcoides kyotonense TaxID=398843 RepID=A0A239JGP0_9NOCA|nr:hypothetical protein SAMN05421642_108196 [Rhodococcus kyotonensis]
MSVLGYITTVVIAVAVAGAAVIGVRSIPDIKRYARMRRM